MNYFSLYVCHMSVFLPAEVCRQQQSPAGCCEAVPGGLVKQDGWPSSPQAFPRSGRLLQLLTECGSTPLSGLCKRRFETLDETQIFEDGIRNIAQLEYMRAGFGSHNIYATMYPAHSLGTRCCWWAFHYPQFTENTADSDNSVFGENTNVSELNSSIAPTWIVTTKDSPVYILTLKYTLSYSPRCHSSPP